MIWEKSLRSNLLMISATSNSLNSVWVTPRRRAFRDMAFILFLSSAVRWLILGLRSTVVHVGTVVVINCQSVSTASAAATPFSTQSDLVTPLDFKVSLSAVALAVSWLRKQHDTQCIIYHSTVLRGHDPEIWLSSSSGGTLEEHSRFHDASPGRTIRCSP